ncbi:MAG: sugar phosphate isomerase/epimerase family protein [Candidatus Latescibacterota bacterium]|nr:sugar phosphate isomerase/epimerase family protein [Candidatus Latescibacterota bacterium]
MPSNFLELTPDHLAAVRDLKLTGVGFHAPGDQLFDVGDDDCRRIRGLFADAGLDMVQFGVGYGECLFDPEETVRNRVLAKIYRGIEVARGIGAHFCLIRTGSLSPRGAYSPDPGNHTRQARRQLIATLRRVATKAEEQNVPVVVETHVLTITDSPETNASVLAEVGSKHLRVVMDCANHFQTMSQVFNSRPRLDRIFDLMGPLSGVGHLKDVKMSDGFVMHIDEEVPGEGLLDLGYLMQRWHALYPDGYMLLEHLPDETYPLAAVNTHRIAAEASVEIH